MEKIWFVLLAKCVRFFCNKHLAINARDTRKTASRLWHKLPVSFGQFFTDLIESAQYEILRRHLKPLRVVSCLQRAGRTDGHILIGDTQGSELNRKAFT
jgi:hypothetical protein